MRGSRGGGGGGGGGAAPPRNLQNLILLILLEMKKFKICYFSYLCTSTIIRQTESIHKIISIQVCVMGFFLH